MSERLDLLPEEHTQVREILDNLILPETYSPMLVEFQRDLSEFNQASQISNLSSTPLIENISSKTSNEVSSEASQTPIMEADDPLFGTDDFQVIENEATAPSGAIQETSKRISNEELASLGFGDFTEENTQAIHSNNQEDNVAQMNKGDVSDTTEGERLDLSDISDVSNFAQGLSGLSKDMPSDLGASESDFSDISDTSNFAQGLSGLSKDMPSDLGASESDFSDISDTSNFAQGLSGLSKDMPSDLGASESDFSDISDTSNFAQGLSGLSKDMPSDLGASESDFSDISDTSNFAQELSGLSKDMPSDLGGLLGDKESELSDITNLPQEFSPGLGGGGGVKAPTEKFSEPEIRGNTALGADDVSLDDFNLPGDSGVGLEALELSQGDKNSLSDDINKQEADSQSNLMHFGDLITPGYDAPTIGTSMPVGKEDFSTEATNDFNLPSPNIDFSNSSIFDSPSIDINVPTLGMEGNNIDSKDILGGGGGYTENKQEDNYQLSDQELAGIREALGNYNPEVRKLVIGSVVNEKLGSKEINKLLELLVSRAAANRVLSFIRENSQDLGGDVDILYADGLSPEDIARRKRRTRFILGISGLSFASLIFFFGYASLRHYFGVQKLYEEGLKELKKAEQSFLPAERENLRTRAENYFQRALKENKNELESDMLRRYGLAYMRARFYSEAFEKLFGRSQPPYLNFKNWKQIPLIKNVPQRAWEGDKGVGTLFSDQTGLIRKVVVAGAFMVDRLRDKTLDKKNILALARFHSNSANDFIEGDYVQYKNDLLAMDYYNSILSLMDKPRDIDALLGIGDLYYNQKAYSRAMNQYLKVIELYPLEVQGHAHLLNTYIEMFRVDSDPRVVLAKHRELQRKGMETKFPMYLLVKLAGFYTHLDTDDVRIKYQVNPIDTATNLDLLDTAKRLLEIAYSKEEIQDGEKIKGSEYAEGFYQRGLFMQKMGERLRAVKNFQEAHYNDPLHYLAISALGENYKESKDFDKAAEYFSKALEVYGKFIKYAGRRPEDETLLHGDLGKIYYNAGLVVYLRYAGLNEKDKIGVVASNLHPIATQKIETNDMTERRQRLDLAYDYFQKALELKMQNSKEYAQLLYATGWIDYMNGNFAEALNRWEEVDAKIQNSDPALSLAKGNAYYFMNQNQSALGHYTKLASDLEGDSKLIKRQGKYALRISERQALVAQVYNNIGAVYEREAENFDKGDSTHIDLEKQALLYYWKAIENAQKSGISDEIARANIQIAFKTKEKREPIIFDSPPALLFSL